MHVDCATAKLRSNRKRCRSTEDQSDYISAISARSSSLVLPSRFWRRPRSSSSLPSAKARSSSVSLPYFCLSLPLTSFQLPFNCSFITRRIRRSDRDRSYSVSKEKQNAPLLPAHGETERR